MLAAIATSLALALSPVQTCHIDNRGNANDCNVSFQLSHGLDQPLRGRTLITWEDSRSFLYAARVNGQRGRWNAAHDLLVWRKLRVTFNGIAFTDYSHRKVHILAISEPWS